MAEAGVMSSEIFAFRATCSVAFPSMSWRLSNVIPYTLASSPIPIFCLAFLEARSSSIRNKRRIDDALASKKARQKIGIGELAKVYGITFDKRQLIEGKATEHVALMAKISEDMTPASAIETVLKMREYNAAIQEEATNKKR